MAEASEKPRMRIMKELGIGESHDFPLGKYAAISSDCTRYGKMWGKRFSMKTNTEARTVTVTRKA